MSFIHDDFLLSNDVSRELFHNYAHGRPIYDYHCHLPPQEIAQNKRWKNLTDVWLTGDHYKWRLMRANGVSEELITGKADDKEKYLAYVRSLRQAPRSPIFHWSHLELKRYFEIDDLLTEENADTIWERANARIQDESFNVSAILEQFRVKVVCTTDDPLDSLEHHKEIAAQQHPVKVFPTYRPDKGMALNDLAAWNKWVDSLQELSGEKCDDLKGFLNALENRHDYFSSLGGRLSDHGLERCPSGYASEGDAAKIYKKARAGKAINDDDIESLRGFLMLHFGRLDAAKEWTKQLHLGAQRNNATRLFSRLGPDSGGDSIGDFPQGRSLSRYMDELDKTNQLPRMVLYNLNPADNYLFASMIGNFQDGSIAGKIQFGSAWWFNDTLKGMEAQIDALSECGLLGRFVGMLTDSRSFLSFPRHEYFRRLVCDILGRDVEKGLLPRDIGWLGGIVENICHRNAERFFGFEV